MRNESNIEQVQVRTARESTWAAMRSQRARKVLRSMVSTWLLVGRFHLTDASRTHDPQSKLF